MKLGPFGGNDIWLPLSNFEETAHQIVAARRNYQLSKFTPFYQILSGLSVLECHKFCRDACSPGDPFVA